MIGKTNSQTGGAIKGEKLNISLKTNQQSHSDLVGAVITVTHAGGTTEYVWEGYEITVDVPPYLDYTVSYSAVSGYATPAAFTSTSIADNSRTLTGTYNTEIVSVAASADDSASVNGVTITINGTSHTYNGTAITQKVPFGTQYTVSASAKTNYAAPATQTFTAAQASRSVSMVYVASNLTVSIASNQTNDTTIAAVKATVAYGSTSVQVSNGQTVGIPVNTNVTVTFPAVDGYKTPEAVTVNNTGGTKTASGTYNTEVVTVTVSADNGESMSGQVITINGTAHTYSGSAITQKVPYDTTYTVSASAKDGYTTPASQTFTASQSGRNLSLQYVYNPTKDLSMYDIYGKSISQTTANCYVVSEPGMYKFPLVFGNAIKDGAVNSAAYTKNSGSYSMDFLDYGGAKITSPYIETVSGEASSVQLSIADANGVITDLSLASGTNCRYVQFTVASVPATGANAIISVKNSSGTIMWNWHVWLWADDLTPVEITNSTSVKYNILPVNLASTWDDSTKAQIKNWYYQWGRPTPLLGPAAYNSTTNATSYGALSFTIASYASAFKLGIQNPATFYKYNSSGTYNWFGSSSYYNLWDANCTSTGNSDNTVVKTVYDPCPIGFHIPNGNTFTYFSTSNVVGSFSSGYRFKRNSSDTTGVFFPASGYRRNSSGLLDGVGSLGYVWLSSAYSQNYAYLLYFASGYVNPQHGSSRAYGFSVRPVQE